MSDHQTPDTPTPDKPTRAEIARANSAKSTGPVSTLGKARSALNATRHGLYARQIVLPAESRDEFQALLDSYVEQYRPQTTHEHELVSVMAATRWRLTRLLAIETNLLAKRMESRAEDIARYVPNPTTDVVIAWVFDGMSGGTALPLLTRYEGALTRTYDRAFKQLQILRGEARKAGKLNTPTTKRSNILDSPVETNPAE